MKTLFISSLKEDLSFAAYSRHLGMKKLFLELGDVESINIYSGATSFFQRILAFFDVVQRIKKKMANIDLKDIDAIFLSTISYSGMKYIKKLCKKNNIKLIIDCVEWASPEEKKLGKLSFSYIHNTRINEHLIDKSVRVVSISTYLENYFKSKDIKTAVVPNLIDVKETQYIQKNKHSKLELLFAGYPQKKDALNVAVEGLLSLPNEDRELVHLTVAGVTRDTFFEKYSYLIQYEEEIMSFTSFKGRLPSIEIRKLYEETDFSVLVRDNSLRVCKAGFPTKLLDSFKYSTPIIANLSSDIGKYLIDQVNGFVVDNYSKESCCATFKRIISLFKDDKLNLEKMNKNAFDTCINSFNYLNFVDTIKKLIND